MSDLGHRLTDAELSKLEKKIAKVYRDAYNDLQKKVETYFKRFEKRDNAIKSKLEAGEITEDYYKQWRLAQMGRGERFEALRDEVAERMTKATEVAMSYINDTTPGIYSLNRNYEAYVIEQVAGDVGFTVINEQTVKRLITEDPDLLPRRRVNAPLDKKWNRTRFSAEITSGILQGESIKKLADRVQNLSDANRAGAIRNARTAVTGAQNAGRQSTFDSAVKMGIQMQKEWVATLDGRTRHSHRMLDGEVVDYNKKFSNGLMFPGDPSGRAHEVWNCRCAMIAKVRGVGTNDAQRRTRNGTVPNMTYSEWERQKNGLKNQTSNGTLKTGATSGALKRGSQQADDHAKRYYDAVRKMRTDVKRIAENTGYSEEEIQKIKNFVFVDKHELDPGVIARFAPSYEMASSWQRLVDGREIQSHDLTLLAHEKMESELMDKGYTQDQAHILASKKYNYAKEAFEYHDRIERNKEE